MNGDVEVVEDVPAAFAALVAAERPQTIALSGGDTARRCYEAVPSLPGATVLFGDERWVPVDDPESNEGMARRALLGRAGVAEVYSMREAGPTLPAAANAYDALVRDLGAIDVVHLGLGPDGHTASLFPGSSVLDIGHRFVVHTGDHLHPHPRLTFTFPAIALARVAVVTVEGESKRDAFRRVRDGDDVPAARIRADRVLWLVSPEVA